MPGVTENKSRQSGALSSKTQNAPPFGSPFLCGSLQQPLATSRLYGWRTLWHTQDGLWILLLPMTTLLERLPLSVGVLSYRASHLSPTIEALWPKEKTHLYYFYVPSEPDILKVKECEPGHLVALSLSPFLHTHDGMGNCK